MSSAVYAEQLYMNNSIEIALRLQAQFKMLDCEITYPLKRVEDYIYSSVYKIDHYDQVSSK